MSTETREQATAEGDVIETVLTSEEMLRLWLCWLAGRQDAGDELIQCQQEEREKHSLWAALESGVAR